MEELKELLSDISDSYSDFVGAILHYAGRKPERLKKLIDYIKNNPQVRSSDVIRFVSEQDDFFEDAAYALSELREQGLENPMEMDEIITFISEVRRQRC